MSDEEKFFKLEARCLEKMEKEVLNTSCIKEKEKILDTLMHKVAEYDRELSDRIEEVFNDYNTTLIVFSYILGLNDEYRNMI